MQAVKLSFLLCFCTLTGLLSVRGQQPPTSSDPYQLWAVQQWGAAVVNDTTQQATVWGPSADPDRDGLTNLQEYAFGTDPKQTSAYPIAQDFGVAAPGYLTLNYTQRANDAALLVFPQYSTDLQTWWPTPPRDAFSWQGDAAYFWNTMNGAVIGGMQSVTRVCAEPLASSPAAFSRMLVMRSGTVAIGSYLDSVAFFDSISGQAGSSVDSNSVVLSGFAGSVAVSVSGGAHLIVNGADVGTSANVPAGSTLRVHATSPANGASAFYTLTIGGAVTKTWSVASRTPVVPSLTPPAGFANSSFPETQTAPVRRTASKTVLAVSPGVSSSPSGYTPVSASVSESGAASASIPITVSPGTGGMEPKLAITYSSQGGNGPLGVGFGVSGISAVTRTGPVQYLDGIKGGITFGPNDRFTIDGQRLVLYSGAWGADGSEYRTENESFAKITFRATGASGGSYWEMKTKAGLTYQYGNSDDSRILAKRFTGDTAVLSWALTTVTDNLGSRYRCVYAAPTATDFGYPRITSILYTENQAQNLSAGQEVSFIYVGRPDARTSYVAGAKVVMGQILTAIESKQNNNVARRYDFAYQQSEISGNSQLLSVTEKGKKPTNSGDVWQAFPATTFTWDQKPAANMSLVTSAQAPVLTSMKYAKSTPSLTVEGDFNGDGRMDLMDIRDKVSEFWCAFGQSDGSFIFKSGLGGFQAGDQTDNDGNTTTYSVVRTGDFNGDGKTDVLQMNRSGTSSWVALSNGDGTFTVKRGATQLGGLYAVPQTGDYTTQVLAMDFNGDGLTDIVVLYSTKQPVVLRGNGDGSFTKVDPGAAFKALLVTDGRPTYQWVLPGDYNGDGLADILFMYYTGDHTLALSNGDGTFTVRAGSSLGGIDKKSFARSYSYMVAGDFNGDGLTDVANFQDSNPNAAWVSYCKGDSSFEAPAYPSPLQGRTVSNSGNPYTQIVSGDFNGDGFTDIFHAYYYSSVYGFLASPQGNGDFSVLTNGQMGVLDNQVYDADVNNRVVSRIFVGDFDGDGTEDIFNMRYGGTASFLARSNGFNADRVVQVTNGHNGYTKFNYKPLTDPTVYIKGTTAVYPNYDVTGAMYVVASTVTRNGIDGDAFTVQTNPTVGDSTTNYSYERAWSKLDGHGYQGFAAVQSTNQDTGITSRTEYHKGDPTLSGRPDHTIQTLSNGVVISETTNTWLSKTLTLPSGMKIYFPYTSASVSKDYEINNGVGAASVKTTTISGQDYDDFGNLKYTRTDFGGGFSQETTSTYANDTANWWLGRLSETVVKQSSPDQPPVLKRSTFEYSPTNGQVTRETIVTPENNLRLQKDYVHDAFGNIKESTETDLGTGASRTKKTTYTPDGRFIYQITNELNQTETKTYDPLDGTVLTQTGPNGLTTTWTYDGFGRPLTETRPDGTQTFTWYLLCAPGKGVPPRAAHCVYTQSSGSGPSMVFFDLLDRQIRQDATGFDGSTVSTHVVFDKKGQTVSTSLPFFSSSAQPTAPSGQYTNNTLDDVGRITVQDVPGGPNQSDTRTTKTAYAGLSATVTNPKSQTFQTVMDLRGRTSSSTSFGTDAVTNTHDPYGNLIKVDDGRGHVTQMWYDGRGNKTKMTEPNSGTTTYGYNAFGELTSQTDALGRVTTLFYDKLGRMIRRIEPDAPGVINGTVSAGFPVQTEWVYERTPNNQPNPNGIGKLSYVWRQSDGYFESYRYDALGRLTETLTQVGSMQFVTATTFDEYSRPDTLSYPTGFAVRNHYNAAGHLDYVYDAATPTTRYWTATSVNARGQIVGEQLGNGLSTRRGYDPYTGLLGSIQTGKGSGSSFTALVQNLGFSFDKLNNLTERRDLYRGVTETFAYDTTNQLKQVDCTAADTVAIVCDHLGNIQSRSDVGAYTYGERGAGPHAATSIVGVNGQPSHKLFYNAVGNCTQKDDTTLDYNAANQPVAIRAKEGTILFAYTPGRARLKRTDFKAGALTSRVYIGGFYERDDGPDGILHTHFIPAGGGVVAIHTRKQTTGGTTSDIRYVHKDHLGSVQTLTDKDGNVVDTLSYDAWGRRRTLTFNQTTQSLRYSYTDANGGAVTSKQTDRGFTGHEMLDAVGLIHMNGRIYDPTIGRFLSVDPIVQEAGNLQNLNRYCYVLNNPLSLTDPSGFFSIGKFFKKYWKPIVAVAVGVATGGIGAWAALGFEGTFGAALTAAVSGSLGAAIGAGAGYGFGSAFTGTLLSGGSIGDAFRAGVSSGAIGAATAGAISEASTSLGLHGLTTASANFTEKLAEKVAVHGVIGGITSEIQGGKFIHGFLAAGASGGASPFIAGANLSGLSQVAAAAVVGGTASELGGGKFSNGAVTGAFVYLFNEGLKNAVEVSIGYNKLQLAGYHAFVLIQDSGSGQEWYFRAGPDSRFIYSADITTEYGNYLPGSVDYRNKMDIVYLGSVNMSFDQAKTLLINYANLVDGKHLPYSILLQNSNSFAHEAVTRLGVDRPTPPRGIWAPAHDANLLGFGAH